jgi:phosphatidylserine/phosphatidylglycerophosphate/cardiolipin synthase-like enzyme
MIHGVGTDGVRKDEGVKKLSLFLWVLCFSFILMTSCSVSDTIDFELYFDNRQIRQKTLVFISETKTSLDICNYDIEDPQILNIIKDTAENGIMVRIVTEKDNSLAVRKLSEVCKIVTDEDAGLMHCKYMIADNVMLWGGSTNLTTTSLDEHYNDVFITTDPLILRRFSNHFEQSFQGNFKEKRISGQEKGNVFFSPEDDTFSRFMEILSSARQEILIGIYAFSDYRIAHFLKVLSAHGVRILIFADSDWNANNPYSQTKELERYTLVRYDLLEPGLMHEKFIVVDSETVLFGTYNFTASAETKNDEYYIVSRNKDTVHSFRERFYELWDACE